VVSLIYSGGWQNFTKAIPRQQVQQQITSLPCKESSSRARHWPALNGQYLVIETNISGINRFDIPSNTFWARECLDSFFSWSERNKQ